MVPCKSTAYEVSFEWSNHRISSTDSKVRTVLHVSIIDSGSEGFNDHCHVHFGTLCFLYHGACSDGMNFFTRSQILKTSNKLI